MTHTLRGQGPELLSGPSLFASALASSLSSLARRCLMFAGSSSREMSSVAHRNDDPMRERK